MVPEQTPGSGKTIYGDGKTGGTYEQGREQVNKEPWCRIIQGVDNDSVVVGF